MGILLCRLRPLQTAGCPTVLDIHYGLMQAMVRSLLTLFTIRDRGGPHPQVNPRRFTKK